MKTRMRTRHAFCLLLAAACAGVEEEGPPPPETFREVCEPLFACACEAYLHHDVEECMALHHAEYAWMLGGAEATGMHVDLECYLSRERPVGDGCLGWDEYHALHPYDPDPSRCGECRPVYGERQVGEACLEIWGGNDCAQGLLCMGRPGKCVDPCAPAPLGERCFPPTTNCGPGHVCDYVKEVCVEAKVLGDPCTLNEECVEGLVCDFVEDGERVCVVPPPVGGSCVTAECSPEHACLFLDGTWLCQPIPEEGDLCHDHCAGELWCDYTTDTCMRWRELDEACDESMLCGKHLVCEDGTCKSGPEAGEPCDDYCALGFDCVDAVCKPEMPLVCAM